MRTSNDERTASPTALTYFLAGIVAGGLIGGIVGYLAHDLLHVEPLPAPGSDELWVPRPTDADNAPWLENPPANTATTATPSQGLPAPGATEPDPFGDSPPAPVPTNWLGDAQDPSPENPTETEVDPGGVRLNPNDDSMFDAPEP